jgi:TonB family protein
MNPAGLELPQWSRRKWWGAVLGLFALQLALLWWFGASGPVKPRPVAAAPQLRFAGAAAAEFVTLLDPTLFAQGHPQGFSGAAWMPIPVPEYQPPEWSEPPRWLALEAQQLGSDFRLFVQTNQPFAFAPVGKPEPQLALNGRQDESPATAIPSTLQVGGPLAIRRLVNPPALRAWPHSELLSNSVVRVLVDADGNVLSQVLLASSGYRDADDVAVSLAKAAQFERQLQPLAGQAVSAPPAFGTLVFEWQTVPLPATNGPAGSPQP